MSPTYRQLLAGYIGSSRQGPRVRRAFLFAWLVGWVVVFGFLPPHNEASSASNALEVSGSEITYNGLSILYLYLLAILS